jgi:hypothetical protein
MYANAADVTGTQTTLTSQDQLFSEGLRRCFQFWYMLEVNRASLSQA